MSSVTRSFLRYLPRRRSLSVLQLLGIACGVAAVIGMILSARSALWSFTRAIEFLSGKATHAIERPVGPMEESVLTSLMRDPAVDAMSPVIDRRLRLADGQVIKVLAVDPFLDRDLRPALLKSRTLTTERQDTSGFFTFLSDERAIFLDESLAAGLKVSLGSIIETTRGKLRVAGTFPNPSAEPLLLMDIGHGQKLFGLPGLIDRVDLILNDDNAFRTRWSQGYRIQSVKQREKMFESMLSAFRLNLEALSLLALFVGVFLIYNTTMFIVVSRRRDAGILRSLGASKREIAKAFLSEILILGTAGGALGGLLGYFLSRFLTGLVGATISNLYFFLRPTPLPFSIWVPLTGMLLGSTASLAGSFFPLLELERLQLVQTLHGRAPVRLSGQKARTAAVAGIMVILVSILLLLLSWLHVYVGFAGAFGFLFGMSLLTGLALLFFAPPLKKFLHTLGGIAGKIAAGNIRQNLGRTSVAVAAFTVALSMSIGLASMIGSFRQSLIWWMDSQLRAEMYVGSTSEQIEVPEQFYERICSIPGLGGVDPYRNVQAMYRGSAITVAAVDAAVLQRYTHFGWLKGGNENWEPVKHGDVIVSESFARNFTIKAGDTVSLQGAEGPVGLKVAAVFYDYTTEHGLVMMDRSTYLRMYRDHTINSVGIFMDPGNPRRQELLGQVTGEAHAINLPVQTRAELHEKILSVFDSTFAVTRSMRIIAIIVAFFGIAGALLTLFIERQKEFGIYRALGFSTTQVAGMTLMEGVGMGLVSFVLSTVVGTILAVILIKVINLRSFNWTIFFYPAWEPYAMAAITAVLASIGAALYPIWKVLRTYPQMQIREE
jgi:putative ABC transport system permease protein